MDLNNDGIKDILSGSYSGPSDGEKDMAGQFHVLTGNKDGSFNAPAMVNGTDGKPLVIQEEETTARICTRPFAVDWDGDGDLDLVVGNFGGDFYLFRGEGAGKFGPKAVKLQAGTDELSVPNHGDPVVVDWDGDGDLDIVSGSAEGGVFLAENSAGRGKEPILAKFTPLVQSDAAHGIQFGDAAVTPGRDTRVWVADYNGDGKLDLLVGDTSTVAHPVGGITPEQVKQRYEAWLKKLTELEEKLEKIPEAQEKLAEQAEKELEAHRETQDQFMTGESTGFVWLYLRK